MVGLIEPITAWLEEHRGFRRHKSALVALIVIAVLSLLSILSYNTLSGLGIGGKSLNDNLDYLTNQVLLPLGGLAIALFAGWFVSRKASLEELGLDFLMEIDPPVAAWRGGVAAIRGDLKSPQAMEVLGQNQRTRHVLEAHQTLSGVNDKNAREFSNVVEMLEDQVTAKGKPEPKDPQGQ